MNKIDYINGNYTLRQLKLPMDYEQIIDISDAVYSFSTIMDHIDLRKYFAEKGCKIGRPKYDSVRMLKIILFAFMEEGIISLRRLEKLCKTDIRYMYLLDDMKSPSHATFGNFIRNELAYSIEDIFQEINTYIINEEQVDLQHTYIDGTKLEANANKYTWVWKKTCLTNRYKLYNKISTLIQDMNHYIMEATGARIETREEYTIEYLELVIKAYGMAAHIDTSTFVSGIGHRKTIEQKQYQLMESYLDRLKTYAEHVQICGDKRNSYSKTDHDATFMRVKKDHMGNDQLLPSYNFQLAVCDEYIAAYTVEQYASDMECFVPLMEKFNKIYGFFPKYPIADAGYGSYNNYIYCQEHGMKKYMKFTMYDKEVTDKKYRENAFRVDNFQRVDGKLICPNGKIFLYKYSKKVQKNKYGRTEEVYECENCENCPYKTKCTRGKGNRKIILNRELTEIHKEVIKNMTSIQGVLLSINRSIQSEGTFGIIKWDRSYKRLLRRGLKAVNVELALICCGFNLAKFHNKRQRKKYAA